VTRTSGLTTLQGYFWHAVLVGDRSLVHRLRSPARQDKYAVAAVLEGMFVLMIGRLCQNRFGPTEIRLFAERAAQRVEAEHGVTAEEMSRIIHRELGDAIANDDVDPAQEVAAQTAVVATAARELKLTPSEIDRMICRSESLAKHWGFALTPYRPGLLMRWRFELAEARWYGRSARDRWSAERMGAFITRLRAVRD
jgi:hypothetical protein